MESRILQMIAALRASGVRVSLAESGEAFQAVDLLGIQDREQFRLSLRATLIKEARDLPTFDKLFPLFFGSGQPPLMGGNPFDQLTPEEAQKLAEALRQFTSQLRERMERLMNGKPLSREELEALAQMVGLNQANDLRYQNWMAQRMLRALAYPEVRRAMEELMQQLAQMGMSSERIQQLRELVQQNMQGMQQQIDQFAGERLAFDERKAGGVMRASQLLAYLGGKQIIHGHTPIPMLSGEPIERSSSSVMLMCDE